MRVRPQDQIQAPRIVHDRLQASNALVFDFCVVPRIAELQLRDNLIDAIFAELFHPAQWIARKRNAQTFEATVDFVRTVVLPNIE